MSLRPVKVYLDQLDYDGIAHVSAELGVSLSQFMRKAALLETARFELDRLDARTPVIEPSWLQEEIPF